MLGTQANFLSRLWSQVYKHTSLTMKKYLSEKIESNLKLTNVVGRDVQHKSIETSDPHLDSKSFHRKSPKLKLLLTGLRGPSRP